MKRRILLFMMTALLSVGAWATTENVWTGSVTPGWYQGEGDEGEKNHFGEVGFTASRKLMRGDYIVVTATTSNQWYNQIKVCKVSDNGNWAGDVLTTISNYDFSSNDSKLIIPVSEDIVSALNSETTPQYTLYFDGYNYTMTSVDVVYNQGKANLYYNASGEARRFYGGRLLTPHLFAAASVGDIVTIDISRVGNDDDPVVVDTQWGENVKIYNKCPMSAWNSGTSSFEDPEGLEELTTLKVSTAPTTLSLVLTETLLENAKVNGLSLGGGNYNYTSVDLLYAHDVTIAEGMTNGNVTTDKTRAAAGETVTLTVTTDDNYELGTLTVKDANGATVSTSGSDVTYSFTMPATAVTVNATFTESDNSETLTPTSTSNAEEKVAAAFESVYTLGTGTDAKTLTIKVEKTEVSENSGTYKTNGTISASATTAGDVTTITLTPTPAENYKLSKLIIEKTADAGSANARTRSASAPTTGVFIPATKDDGTGTWTFTMPESSVIISATFAKAVPPQKPTLAYDQATRTITINNTEYVAGSSVTATLHYTLSGGTEQTTTDASVTTEAITVNTTVTAWIVSTETGSSENVEATFKVAAKPTVSYTDGDNKVSLALTPATATNTADSKLYYTTDGSEPTISSTQLTEAGTINITEGMTTIKVLALDTDDNYSEIVEQSVAYAYYLTASKEWTTYYSDKTFSVPTGLKAYTVASVTAPADGQSGTVVVAEQTVIAKNTPMLIQNESAGTTDQYRVYTTDDQTITGTATEFKGVAIDTELDNDGTPRYVLVDGVFLRTTGGTLPANRCYLEFGSAAAGARSFSITVGDKTTAIESVGITTQEGEDQWYDLQGRRVMQPQKGIYIRNGKKVVVR